MIAALLTFAAFCCALWCWAWERLRDEHEYDD